jgi:hypothetical protein
MGGSMGSDIPITSSSKNTWNSYEARMSIMRLIMMNAFLACVLSYAAGHFAILLQGNPPPENTMYLIAFMLVGSIATFGFSVLSAFTLFFQNYVSTRYNVRAAK